MSPAHPPLPTPASLPFQFASGIQTSNRIWDSAVGAITPATRQNGGRFCIALLAPGGANEPFVISCAVIVVFGRAREARVAHAPAGACAAGRERDVSRIASANVCLMA